MSIHASPAQVRRLRNGHSVRVKKGTGFNVLVHPSTFHLASKSFNKEKGYQLKLSPEEIQANRGLTPEEHARVRGETAEMTGVQPAMEGQGIFGAKFDRFLARTGLNKITDPLGNALKPLLKEGIKRGTKALSFIPHVERAGKVAEDYLDNPSKYNEHGLKEGLKEAGKTFMSGEGFHHRHRKLRGAGMGNSQLAKSTYGGLESSMRSKHMADEAIHQRQGSRPKYQEFGREENAPFSRGYGLGAGMRQHHNHNNSIIGRGGGMVSYLPPALISQPYSANFQMSHFLPVGYQMFNDSMHEPYSGHGHGSGLYL